MAIFKPITNNVWFAHYPAARYFNKPRGELPCGKLLHYISSLAERLKS